MYDWLAGPCFAPGWPTDLVDALSPPLYLTPLQPTSSISNVICSTTLSHP